MALSGLRALGWNDGFAAEWGELSALAPGLRPARVVIEHGRFYRVAEAPGQELRAVTAGRLKHEADSSAQMPAVGDWVAVLRGRGEALTTIRHVLSRRGTFSRKAVGEGSEEQIVATNVDAVLLMMGLDDDYNVRRLERYLAVALAGGAQPIVVLNKADLCSDVDARRAEIAAVAAGVAVITTSLHQPDGDAPVRAFLEPGRTAVLVGSSGVGKSTLLNRLLGADVQRTTKVRSYDQRGRHTTSGAQLFTLPRGALVIDTPGIRELQLWDTGGVEGAFDDVDAVATGCRFRDCRHMAEPGCAVRAAVESGVLPIKRYESFLMLRGAPNMQRRQSRRRKS